MLSWKLEIHWCVCVRVHVSMVSSTACSYLLTETRGMDLGPTSLKFVLKLTLKFILIYQEHHIIILICYCFLKTRSIVHWSLPSGRWCLVDLWHALWKASNSIIELNLELSCNILKFNLSWLDVVVACCLFCSTRTVWLSFVFLFFGLLDPPIEKACYYLKEKHATKSCVAPVVL